MVVACLLHDVSYCEKFEGKDDWLNHGRRASQIVRPYIETLDFKKEEVDDILYGIAIHVDDKADFEGEKTPFALSVGDADNIDRFDTYRIYENLKNALFDELPYENQLQICTKKIENLQKYLSMEFATATSTNLLKDKLKFQLQFYNRLKHQLENSIFII